MKKKLIGLTGVLALALLGTTAQASSCGVVDSYSYSYSYSYIATETTTYYTTCNTCDKPKPKPCHRCSHNEIGFIWP